MLALEIIFGIGFVVFVVLAGLAGFDGDAVRLGGGAAAVVVVLGVLVAGMLGFVWPKIDPGPTSGHLWPETYQMRDSP